jgi:hypothetical protein
MAETMPDSNSHAQKPQLMVPALRGFIKPYGIAIMAVALGLAVRLALQSVLSGEASYLFSNGFDS